MNYEFHHPNEVCVNGFSRLSCGQIRPFILLCFLSIPFYQKSDFAGKGKRGDFPVSLLYVGQELLRVVGGHAFIAASSISNLAKPGRLYQAGIMPISPNWGSCISPVWQMSVNPTLC
jgi:hypothetical protein